ncbi:MAG TPA: nucleotide pyrophosphohydrolase [Thermomicrobiales bacterium]|nr:nucleotide pyrophosphohydrolase [Thermomicrobiales bacterium]
MNDQQLSLAEMQASIDAWAKRHWDGEYWPPLANLARLAEEVGELARAVNQAHGPKRVKQHENAAQIAEELGDVLFVLLCIANSTGVNLQTAFDATLARYGVRDEGDGRVGRDAGRDMRDG